MTIRIKYRREPRPGTREQVQRFLEQQGFSTSAGDKNVFTGPDLPHGAIIDFGTALTLSAGVCTRGLQFQDGEGFIEVS